MTVPLNATANDVEYNVVDSSVDRCPAKLWFRSLSSRVEFLSKPVLVCANDSAVRFAQDHLLLPMIALHGISGRGNRLPYVA